MKKLINLLLLSASLSVLFIQPCSAKEYNGEIVKMNASRLEIDVAGYGRRSFQVTKMTRVFMDGGLAVVHRLPTHSKVKVEEKNGIVQLIVVQEVPK